jgi:hypothetical protein
MLMVSETAWVSTKTGMRLTVAWRMARKSPGPGQGRTAAARAPSLAAALTWAFMYSM